PPPQEAPHGPAPMAARLGLPLRCTATPFRCASTLPAHADESLCPAAYRGHTHIRCWLRRETGLDRPDAGDGGRDGDVVWVYGRGIRYHGIRCRLPVGA